MPFLPSTIRSDRDDENLTKSRNPNPDEIAFVGFSESQSALIIEPNLTSVAQPTFEMGRVAAKLLLEQIRNYSETIGPHQSISLQGKLNIRESSQRKDQMHIQ